MPLDFTKPQIAATLNMLLYGGPKVGKSTAAASAPGPLLYVNADGPNGVMFARRKVGDSKFHEVTVTAANAVETLTDVLVHLKTGKGGEQTVVVDTVGELYGRVLEQLSGGGKATLPMYGDTAAHVERFCRGLRDLPVNVVFLAHELSYRNVDTGAAECVPFAGTNSPKLSMKLCAMVDVIGYAVTKTTEDGAVKYGAQLAPGAGRVAGDRTGVLGKARATNLAEWVAMANAAPRSDDAPVALPEPDTLTATTTPEVSA